jgi:ABC-type Na+ transport system ATPase subunit NatA
VAVEEAFIGRTRGDGASAVNAPGDRGDPICELVDVHKRFSGVTVLEGANGLDQGIETERVDGLPLGVRRIVEVARAIVSGPAVVCLDEPAAGLGGAALDHLAEAIAAVARAGSAVLLIEHNRGFVEQVCDRMFEMEDGKVVAILNRSGGDGSPGLSFAEGTP